MDFTLCTVISFILIAILSQLPRGRVRGTVARVVLIGFIAVCKTAKFSFSTLVIRSGRLDFLSRFQVLLPSFLSLIFRHGNSKKESRRIE